MANEWTVPYFESLTKDVSLFVEWASIQRRYKLKAGAINPGWLINLRDTTANFTMMAETYIIKGKRIKYKNFVNQKRYNVSDDWWVLKCEGCLVNDGSVFEDTLVDNNISLKHNGKTVAFVKKLQTYDRFTQHCIIHNVEWNKENYELWRDEIEDDRALNAQFDEWYKDVIDANNN